MASTLQKKNLDSPDEILSFEKEKIQIINLGGITFAKVTRTRMELGEARQAAGKDEQLPSPAYLSSNLRKGKDRNG